MVISICASTGFAVFVVIAGCRNTCSAMRCRFLHIWWERVLAIDQSTTYCFVRGSGKKKQNKLRWEGEGGGGEEIGWHISLTCHFFLTFDTVVWHSDLHGINSRASCSLTHAVSWFRFTKSLWLTHIKRLSLYLSSLIGELSLLLRWLDFWSDLPLRHWLA